MKHPNAAVRLRNPRALHRFVAIHGEREYDLAVEQLNRLVDEVGDSRRGLRYRLIETLSILIAAYDQEHNQLPEASGADVVRYLMTEHGLSQKQLPEIGSQGVVSEILSGRRELNVRQIRALAARFGVEPGAFIGRAVR